MSRFRRKVFISGVVFLFFLASFNEFMHAEEKEKDPKVLVIYSSIDGKIDEHQRMLDLLLGHFSNRVSFKSTKEVTQEDFKEIDYLFYYGHEREVIRDSVKKLINSFDGTTVAIGYNFEQLQDKFDYISQLGNHMSVQKMFTATHSDEPIHVDSQPVIHVQIENENDTDILAWGEDDSNQYPLFIRNNDHYYFASSTLLPPYSLPFADVLHDVFEMDSDHTTNYGYIRLEDIHPFVDPEQLMEIAEILKERNIPYMIAVIPVYTNPITKKRYHFSDSPKLLKTLKFMQENGGSIVLHGYTHQFRLSETGEGFEFWDVEHNMPIYHNQDDEVIVKTRDDFQSDEQYEQYVADQKSFERKYIEERLTNGIEELANYGLYPLAFEAPHYTMSQNGYEVVADYFTTYVGQIQLSDNDWEIMSTIPYQSQPNLLHGMTLLPETIGYVRPEDRNAIEKMIQSAHNYLNVRDGMIAGFYHPYLGSERLIALLDQLENIPNIQWIDLKEMDNEVKTELVSISSQNGEIHADINHLNLFQKSFDYLDYHIKNVITFALWIVAVIGALGIFIFIIFIIAASRKSEKRRGDLVG